MICRTTQNLIDIFGGAPEQFENVYSEGYQRLDLIGVVTPCRALYCAAFYLRSTKIA